MEVESPALDAFVTVVGLTQPDLLNFVSELQKEANAKRYHQFTIVLMEFLNSPALAQALAASAAGTAKNLLDFFNSFIKDFEKHLDKVRWVQILAIVAKPQDATVALDLIVSFEESAGGERDSKFLWQCLKAEKLLLVNQVDDAKDLLENLGKEIDGSYEVDALIQSTFHKSYALLWSHLGKSKAYYQSSLLYLAFTPLSAIPEEERPSLAFQISVAALIAEDEFNFGELMQQELLASLEGSQFEWIKDFLTAFAEGKFDLYDASLANHSAKVEAVKELNDDVMRPKMAALALMELAFRKPKKQRRLSFEEVAQHCRVGPKEVEFLVMKAMCAKLICGKIDEVERLIIVTWVKPRILDTARVGLLRDRMDTWAAQTGLLLEHLEEMTPELLVS